ncbi:MAG: DotU family type IV/VI secretion system protein [Polyangiaceae bacterium]|nr:DotU family type IV/VI secretion system protein [Polyangiaceae bacterium]
MGSTTALWFDIEAAFREALDLCVRARASQIAFEQARSRAPAGRGAANAAFSVGAPAARAAAAGPRRAPDADGEATVPLAVGVDVGATLPLAVGAGGGATVPLAVGDDGATVPLAVGADGDRRLAGAAELARERALRGEPPAPADLVALRALLRKRLIWLRAKFAEVLSEHDVYYALFPLVVYIDELVQVATRGEAARWQPLQGELFDVDNGGELFFTVIEDKLRQQETHPFVFEVFYFCLAHGFLGMYQDDRKKLGEYAARLAERVPGRPAAPAAPRAVERGVELVPFPWHYYAIASGAVLVLYLALSWLGTPG